MIFNNSFFKSFISCTIFFNFIRNIFILYPIIK
nr:MAG TPA: hypothetical protein [Caudoviricetes sp.]